MKFIGLFIALFAAAAIALIWNVTASTAENAQSYESVTSMSDTELRTHSIEELQDLRDDVQFHGKNSDTPDALVNRELDRLDAAVLEKHDAGHR